MVRISIDEKKSSYQYLISVVNLFEDLTKHYVKEKKGKSSALVINMGWSGRNIPHLEQKVSFSPIWKWLLKTWGKISISDNRLNVSKWLLECLFYFGIKKMLMVWFYISNIGMDIVEVKIFQIGIGKNLFKVNRSTLVSREDSFRTLKRLIFKEFY